MIKLKIQNFGPIKSGYTDSSDGYFEINRISVLIGNQGTGKSTIAKVYSTFSWLEKALTRDYYYPNNEINSNDFIDLCKHQNLPVEYFNDKTELGYKGKSCSFLFRQNKFIVEKKSLNITEYICPKIMYIPSERNILSVLEDIEQVKNIPQMLKEFKYELKISNKKLLKVSSFNVLNNQITYDETSDLNFVQPQNSFNKIPITKASSGLQSIIPLILVTKTLAQDVNKDILLRIKDMNAANQNFVLDEIKDLNLMGSLKVYLMTDIQKHISENDKNKLVSQLSNYVNSCFVNIVEEPEQNLYPDSQKVVLYELLKYCNSNGNNKLLITTHSPYILSYLTLAIKANELVLNGVDQTRIEKIVPIDSCFSNDNVSVFALDENGRIELLNCDNNLPSDDNFLNNAMAKTNDDFANLLDLFDE